MQSLNPHNAKTYDYMRRSNDVADRILNKSKQLLAKTWDKKHSKSMRGRFNGSKDTRSRSPVKRVCSPSKYTDIASKSHHSSDSSYRLGSEENVTLLNPELYMYV